MNTFFCSFLVFRSARTSCRTFDSPPVHPSRPPVPSTRPVHPSAPIFPEFIDELKHCRQASGTPQIVYFLKADDVSYPNLEENTNKKTNTQTNTQTNTNKGKIDDTYDVIYFWSWSWIFSRFLKKSMGIESTGKMWLVSNSEIKVGKEQVDHEIFENEMTKGFWIWYALGNI